MGIYLGGPVNDTPPGLFIGKPGPTIFRKESPTPPGSERIEEPFFATDNGYSFSGASWTIAANTATNNTASEFMSAGLLEPTIGGESYSFDLGVAANPAGAPAIVQLFNSTTLATQTILDGSVSAPVGLWNFTGTVTGIFDILRIAAGDDPGLVLNKYSFIA